MSTVGRERTQSFSQKQSNQENTKFSQHHTTSNKPNPGIESLEAEEGGKVEQSLIRRRRAGTRSLPGGEGQAPGAEPGGEGQDRSKPQLISKQ
jgi:hypothetical protein